MKKTVKRGFELLVDGVAELRLLAALVESPDLAGKLECGRFNLVDLFEVHLEQFIQFLYALEYGDPLPDVPADPPADLSATMERLAGLAAERERMGTMRDGGLRVARAGLYRVKVSRADPERKAGAIDFFASLIRDIVAMKSDGEFMLRFAVDFDAGGASPHSGKGKRRKCSLFPHGPGDGERGGNKKRHRRGLITAMAEVFSRKGRILSYYDPLPGGVSCVEEDDQLLLPRPGSSRFDDDASLCGPAAVAAGKEFLLESINTTLYGRLRHAVARGGRAFVTSEGAFPRANLKDRSGNLQAIVQLKPDLESLNFLPESKIFELQVQMTAISKKLSDRTVDCLDIISSKWLKSAKSPDATVKVSADDFLKLFGTKRPTTELRRKVALEIDRLKTLTITVESMVVPGDHGKMKIQSGDPGAEESPAVIVTSRHGELKSNGIVECYEWYVRPGDHFAQYLFSRFRPVSLLPKVVLQLDPYRRKWEKRIARYLENKWASTLDTSGLSDVVTVKSLLIAVGDNLSRNRDTKARLNDALDCLCGTQSLFVKWDYCRDDGGDVGAVVPFDAWESWKVVFSIHADYAALCLQAQYKKKEVQQRGSTVFPGIDEAIKSRGLSEYKAAQLIGINRSTLSRIIRGEVNGVTRETARKIRAWLGIPV